MAPSEPNHKPFQIQGEEPHFEEELEGWGGYIEWEKYPEKKKQAKKVLSQYDFPVVSEMRGDWNGFLCLALCQGNIADYGSPRSFN